MNIQRVRDCRMDDFTLIGSLPDMGKVGGLVSQHISKKLDAQLVAKITVSDKPWINQKKGLVSVPQDEYRLAADEKNRILVFEGNGQPQEPGTVRELTELVFSEAQKIGTISRVISAGGYLPAPQGGQDQVFGVAATQQTLDYLAGLQVFPLSSDVNSITWFNGLVLGKAKDCGMEAMGLFGEIADSNTPQYRAASNVIRKIEEILGVPIGTEEIDAQIVEPAAEAKKDSPGIG